MLNIHIDSMSNLKYLREEILEQLGKNVVSFDLKFDVEYLTVAKRFALSTQTTLRQNYYA